jgi:hypothetical protein
MLARELAVVYAGAAAKWEWKRIALGSSSWFRTKHEKQGGQFLRNTYACGDTELAFA